MEREILTPAEAAVILNAADQVLKARIFEASTQKPFSIQIVTLDLSTARLQTNPYKIGFPFKSVYVEAATDVLANIEMQIGMQDTIQSSVTMKLNDSLSLDIPTSEAYIWWPAQTAKTITLVFFTAAEFRSGSQISVTGGGVSIVDGSTLTHPDRVVLAAATPTIIAPALATRKCATLQNATGAEMWIGGTTVSNTGAKQGILIPANGVVEWRNTGALYGFSVAGGAVINLEEA